MGSVVEGWQTVLALSRSLWSRHRAGEGSGPRVQAFVRPRHLPSIESAASEGRWILTVSELPPTESMQWADEPAPIILLDRELPPGNWREWIARLTRNSPRPYVILLSPNSDGNLWDELQRVGGSDILRTPMDRDSVLQAVRRAWSLWYSQQQVRRPAGYRP